MADPIDLKKLSAEKMAEMLETSKSAQTELENKLKSEQDTVQALQIELEKANAALELKSDTNVVAASKQAALQERYFRKQFPAKVSGSITLEEDGKEVEVEILHGVASIQETVNVFELSIAKIDIGKTNEKGEPIYDVIKDESGKIYLANAIKYASKVPKIKEFFQLLFDKKVNIFANKKGEALFAQKSNTTNEIVKL